MINQHLFSPGSIAVIGGSNNTGKPGGRLLQNIINGGFRGAVYVVNPKEDAVQDIPSYPSASVIPPVDLAILAVAAELCPSIVKILAEEKGTKAFIVISAGFSEDGEQGLLMEKQMVDIANKHKACLIGPNCIGVITPAYNGVFTSPVPRLSAQGCDFVSGSGATAVFIAESAIPKGLTFSSIISVGNSAQTGVEEIVEYWDNTYQPGKSSEVKLLYVENIHNPDKLLHHASSLIRKGCRIAAIKAGTTEAGNRAASSHTGALASSDSAVEALFRKAGIVRCFGREELTTVASVLVNKHSKGKNIAIITHAGGPAVMLTDALASGGLHIPPITGDDKNNLLNMMNRGASADNPIDLIATATSEQLEKVIDYVDKKLNYIDSIIVIYGYNGLTDIKEIYEVLHKKIISCEKPIFPILPSISSSRAELETFIRAGHISFPDEVVLGKALTRIANTPYPADDRIFLDDVDIPLIRKIIDKAEAGYLQPETVQDLLSAAGIPMVEENIVCSGRVLRKIADEMGFPVALKAVGPVHKSEIGGVTLNIKSEIHLLAEYRRMMKIKGVSAVLMQKMMTGTELFIGASYAPRFGHVILCGMGGIFVEMLNDFSSGLAPLTPEEAKSMIRSLKSYPIIKGARGKAGVDENRFIEIIVRLSSLLRFATEIKEMDLNPLIGNEDEIAVVDARIRIEKETET